ncbi:MAG: Gfo/Idh/MocA family oxidoreductase [Oscillospiraceae bacterium]|nr:Gfo/Idh/MocA family oxidoreductase [Oscillospiraceae bacterium]
MFKVGLIGCGNIVNSHVSAIAHVDELTVTAACDISEANLKRMCDKTGATGYSDYKEMVKNEELDLVIISLPHALHREATCFCAEAGLDIFLEKPMGISSDDCREMIDACNKAGVMLWVGHPQRYFPTNMFAKELIDSGELGELVGFDETRNCEYFTENRPKWFLTKSMSGGGIMFNLGAHALDKIKYFCGDEKIAFATGSAHIREGFDCEDSAQGFVKMANGVSGTLNLIAHTKAYRYEDILYLTKGEIRIANGEVYYCGEDGVFKTQTFEIVHDNFVLQLMDVVKALKSPDKKPAVDGDFGLDVIHAIKCIYGEEK